MMADKLRASEVLKQLRKQHKKNELLQKWSLFKPVLDRYIVLLNESLLNGYAVDVPGLGTLQVVKREDFKLRKKMIIISRIGFRYFVQLVTDISDKMEFKECASFRKQLRNILTSTTRDYKLYEHPEKSSN